MDLGIQCVPHVSCIAVGTDGIQKKDGEMQHEFVCWPKELDPSEPAHIARWRKRIERDEEYLRNVIRLGKEAGMIVRQNINTQS